MTQAGALTAAIRAAPQDDTLRLVFADWLEEHADPRAGCVRLAVRLRANYGPRGLGGSPPSWEAFGAGIDPPWWAEEAQRLAEEVSDRVGDGGKSAVLIALAVTEAGLLFGEGSVGVDGAALRRVGNQLVEAARRMAVQPRSAAELHRCLESAALGDKEIADALLFAFELAGRDGFIHIKRAPGRLPGKTRVNGQRGLRFALDAEGEELQAAAVLVSLRPLQAEEVRRAMAACAREGTGLLCLCPGLDAQGAEVVRNATDAGVRVLVCATSPPRWRDCFEDAAVATGALPVGIDERGPAEITPARLGRAASACVQKGQLVIEPAAGPPGLDEEWIAHRRRLIQESVGEEEQEWQSYRLAQLTGGVITFEIRGLTDAETERLYWLGCRALQAGRAAIAGGYVPGGGVAYLRAASALPDGPMGQVLRWALEEPTRALLAGSGQDGSAGLESLRGDERLGLDLTATALPFWREAGPIDAARVVQVVLECAVESAIRAAAEGLGRHPE